MIKLNINYNLTYEVISMNLVFKAVEKKDISKKKSSTKNKIFYDKFDEIIKNDLAFEIVYTQYKQVEKKDEKNDAVKIISVKDKDATSTFKIQVRNAQQQYNDRNKTSKYMISIIDDKSQETFSFFRDERKTKNSK